MVHFEKLLHFCLLLAAVVVGLGSILSFFLSTVLGIVPLAKLFSRDKKIHLGN